jgi:hypothetical protein
MGRLSFLPTRRFDPASRTTIHHGLNFVIRLKKLKDPREIQQANEWKKHYTAAPIRTYASAMPTFVPQNHILLL